MRYVIYLRVSTTEQAEHGQGLDVQEEACRAWARSGRHRIVSVCSDAGVSGTAPVADRPGLAAALGHVLGERADGIVVARLDRLARDVILQETVLADLHRADAQLHSCSPTEDAHLVDDQDDPTRALVRRILGAVSAYERDVIRLRLRAGSARRLSEEGYAGGRPPFGWRVERGRLVEHEAEQLAVEQIFALSEAGLSRRQIAAALEEEGWKSRKSDGTWRPATISEIVRRGRDRPDYRKPSTPSHAPA